MKFKHIIISFNILIIVFLLVIALTPLIALGSEFAVKFWISGWPLALVLVLTLIGLNVFFLMNKRLFKLLEREDWPALVDYLEHRLYDKNSYPQSLVRLLANSCIILSDSEAVMRLEKKVSAAKPALLDKNALIFGTARILGGDISGAASFFKARLEKGRVKNTQWIRFFYSFAQLLSRDFKAAETGFSALAAGSDEAVITGLSSWFLSETLYKFSAGQDECIKQAEQGRQRILQKFKTSDAWKKEAAKIETEIHAALIKKYIDQCAAWLYNK